MIIFVSDKHQKRILELLGTSPLDTNIRHAIDPRGLHHEPEIRLSKEDRQRLQDWLFWREFEPTIDNYRESIHCFLETGCVGYKMITDAELVDAICECIEEGNSANPDPDLTGFELIPDVQRELADRQQAAAERAAERRLERP